MAGQRTIRRAKSSLRAKLERVRLFATDVDGVLTDGGMYLSESGDEMKKFNTRDGMGIKLLQAAGIVTALITMEETKLVSRRAGKLAVPEVHQGVRDKLAVLRALCAKYGYALDQVAYMGDDVNDLEALGAAGFSAAPADAIPAVRNTVTYVCKSRGGAGAVREAADLILSARNPSQS